MIFAVGFVPITNLLGGTQAAWIKVGLVLGAIAMLGLFIGFITTKEESVGRVIKKDEHVPIAQGIKPLITNKYWVIMTLAQLVAHVSYGLSQSTNVYYARWIFGDESIVGIMGIVGFVPALLGFFITGPLVRKFGATKVVKYALLLGIVGAIGRAVFPYSFVAVCIFGGLNSLATMPFMMVSNVLVSNAADFKEWRSGKKIVGLVNSASSFGAKVGSGIGAGLIGIVLELGGYLSNSPTQSESAIDSVFAISIWIPGALIIVLLLLMMAYNLDTKYPRFREELTKRRAAQEQTKQ